MYELEFICIYCIGMCAFGIVNFHGCIIAVHAKAVIAILAIAVINSNKNSIYVILLIVYP